MDSTSSFVREKRLIQLLSAFIMAGLFFCIFPGTLIGVANLFAIAKAQSMTTLSAAWVQAHGHAQLFGWLGSFILGIGFYSMPKLRHIASERYLEGWLCWFLWTFGVLIHWYSQGYNWQWQQLLPLSGAMELSAIVIFIACTVQGHNKQIKASKAVSVWALVVVAATVGLLLATMANLAVAFHLSITNIAPIVPDAADKTILTLTCWAFVVPMVAGFTAHWLTPLLSLAQPRESFFLIALIATWIGILLLVIGGTISSAFMIVLAAITWTYALRIFDTAGVPHVSGVHSSYPFFIKMSYFWLLLSSLLAFVGVFPLAPPGYPGAARHALTVGFFSLMVFNVAPRMLPAFLGKKSLYSPFLMGLSSLLLTVGCAMRVIAQIYSYGHAGGAAWMFLPISASIELLAMLCFAWNIFRTIISNPILSLSCNGRKDLKQQI